MHQENSDETKKVPLSRSWKRLLRIMQSIYFGRIDGLAVRQGEPVFEPAPRIVREVRFGRGCDFKEELSTRDLVLKAQVKDLFACLSQLSSGQVERLEIKHGLPFSMKIEEV